MSSVASLQGQVRRLLAVRLANQLRYERQIVRDLRQNHAAKVIQVSHI